MKIGSEVGGQSTPTLDQQNGVQDINSQHEKQNIILDRVNARASDKLTLSTEGQLIQEIDLASDKIDSILEQHLTQEQEKELSTIYDKLDKLFEKDNLTKQEESLAEGLNEQVHNILETSIEKLSDEEHLVVDGLAKKMDMLTIKLENIETSNAEKNNSSIVSVNKTNNQASYIESETQANKQTFTVAELNALSTSELHTLPANLLRKLNTKQLNRLNINQLNTLALAQLKQLNPSNIEKLNQSQLNKLDSV